MSGNSDKEVNIIDQSGNDINFHPLRDQSGSKEVFIRARKPTNTRKKKEEENKKSEKRSIENKKEEDITAAAVLLLRLPPRHHQMKVRMRNPKGRNKN